METLNLLKSGQLTGQKRLKLACGLTEFPMEILDLADSLEILDLSNNHLRTLPDAFGQLKNLKIAFFNNNQFEDFPTVLAACPKLSMISFKGNQITTVTEEALSPTIRWLILTNNQIETLPASIGNLSTLQKLMLAGNRLTALPEEMAACQNLELIRLSANRLQSLPDWLLTLPRLSWLAYAGNPFCETPAAASASLRSLSTIDADQLAFGEILGQGASGIIYKGRWATADSTHTEAKSVAIKLFKGEITSDGSPLDEMQACIAAGAHPNLVTVLGKLANHFDHKADSKAGSKAGLVFSFVPPDYTNLGGPPDLDTCTRDTYDTDTTFSLASILTITRGIASAVAHLHRQGILHGDLYAHNILVNETGASILGDFGAASFYDPSHSARGQSLERLEVRAFGCLLEDLLDRCAHPQETASQIAQLRRLQQDCLAPIPTMRPLFNDICETLADLTRL
ncbi:MAG: leucine-rich repeat-containing protein kinase family protein [Cyanobacteria bacterium P01_A01_bin.114]